MRLRSAAIHVRRGRFAGVSRTDSSCFGIGPIGASRKCRFFSHLIVGDLFRTGAAGGEQNEEREEEQKWFDCHAHVLSTTGRCKIQVGVPDGGDTVEQQQQTIRITLDDETAQGAYINFANIIHSPSEFIIDLGRMVPGRPDVKIYSRAIMTPLHAKQLLQALAQNVSIFEQKFGEIRMDEASGFVESEASN